VKKFNRQFYTILAIFLFIIVLGEVFQNDGLGSSTKRVDFSDFMADVNAGKVQHTTIQGLEIQAVYKDGTSVKSRSPYDGEVTKNLLENQVGVRSVPIKSSTFWDILISWFPMLLFIGVWFFMMRQMHGGGGKAMGFGKSKAKLMTEHTGKRITFADVAGANQAKEDLEETVEFLKNPEKFTKLGARIPQGMLLVGPPGTGKTLLAKAVAGEASVPFFSISGSDFVEMFVGVGASRVRDMFEQARSNSPCIIFIDEIDAVGRHRGAGLGGGNDEREQTLNQMLVEMDGFDGHEGVIVLAATNRADVLDPALLRPGRFDRQVMVPHPDLEGRLGILKIHTRKIPLDKDVDLRVLARMTPGFSGADLENFANEAALIAARRDKKLVSIVDFDDAKDKIIMGSERRTIHLSAAELKLTAYHEAGHALVALNKPASMPIHKATIVPRGNALGMVVRLPEDDQTSMRRDELEANLAIAMGGRIAEELLHGKDGVTTGASGDLQMVSDVARRMIKEWALDDELGFLAYGEPQQEVFLGHSVTQTQTMSGATAQQVDGAVRKLVDRIYADTYQLIKDKWSDLIKIGDALLMYETLTGDELKKLLAGDDLGRDKPEKTLLELIEEREAAKKAAKSTSADSSKKTDDEAQDVAKPKSSDQNDPDQTGDNKEGGSEPKRSVPCSKPKK
jgi:cell division protease FtsH